MKFESNPIREHEEVPLADDGDLENLVEHWQHRAARRQGSSSSRNCCYVICVGDWSEDYSRDAQLAEIIGLVEAQGDRVVGSETVKQRRPAPETVLRSGKAKAAVETAIHLGANMLVVDAELKPSQIRNLEDLAGMPILWPGRCDPERVLASRKDADGAYSGRDCALEVFEAPDLRAWA